MEDVKTRKLKEMADKLQLKEKQNQVCSSSRLCRIFLFGSKSGKVGGVGSLRERSLTKVHYSPCKNLQLGSVS